MDNCLEISIDLAAPDICPCGSGKKPKRCCGPLKPRTHTLKMDAKNQQFADGIAINLTNLTLQRIVDGMPLPVIGETVVSQSYDRPKGPKDLVVANLHKHHSLDPNGIFLEYDEFFIIDTNTRIANDEAVALSAIMTAYAEHAENNQIKLKYTPFGYLEFRNPQVPPENIGWMALAGALQENPEFSKKRIALVVDSDKGKLDAFNKRELPICQDFYLPINIKLLYASADGGTSFLNRLMKRCDKQAARMLSLIIDTQNRKGLQVPDTYPCSHFRQLKAGDEDPNWKISKK